jgi:antitoxin (DNA-binding transcriptional repressor) of toxin-antitoxin stability system
MIVISVNELQADLSMYLDEIGKGKQIIIQKNKKDIALLSPVSKTDWRDKMTVRPKLLVSPEEIVEPMTDVWEGGDDIEPMPLKNEMDDDLRPEYDLSKLKGGVRGKYASRCKEGQLQRPGPDRRAEKIASCGGDLRDGKDSCLGCTEHESPGEQLARLIKEAGQEARARREKTLEKHFQMLKAAVEEGGLRRKKPVKNEW